MTPVQIYNAVDGFISRNSGILALYAYFLVMAMAPELPWPFNKIPALEWFYEWQRKALQSLFTSRHPDLDKKVTVQGVEVQTTVASTPDKKEDVDTAKGNGLS